MGRKKKVPEAENLERWLVSYGDFITLLFATFVVLYALSQVDISDFMKLEESMKQAFAAPSIMEGSEGIMDSSSDSIFDQQQADSMIAPLMLEYLSPKYEEESFDSIEKSIDKMSKDKQLEGVSAEITDRGLLITLEDDYLFAPGSAKLTPKAKQSVDKIGVLINQKFIMHYIRVEGHTDNQPIKSLVFPSNWELSAARSSSIIRYLIERFKFNPTLFTAVGFSDTRPIAENSKPKGRAKNRRVEILVLKNKFKNQESPNDEMIKLSKKEQEIIQAERMRTIERIRDMSDAAKDLAGNDQKAINNTVILDNAYKNEVMRVSDEMKKPITRTMEAPINPTSSTTGTNQWIRPSSRK